MLSEESWPCPACLCIGENRDSLFPPNLESVSHRRNCVGVDDTLARSGLLKGGCWLTIPWSFRRVVCGTAETSAKILLNCTLVEFCAGLSTRIVSNVSAVPQTTPLKDQGIVSQHPP